jgi:hypothetical protein
MAAFLAAGGSPVIVESAGQQRERGRDMARISNGVRFLALGKPDLSGRNEAEPRKFEPDGRSAKIR